MADKVITAFFFFASVFLFAAHVDASPVSDKQVVVEERVVELKH